MLPVTFRCEWGAWVDAPGKVLRGTEGAPVDVPWQSVDKPVRLEVTDGDELRCAASLTGDQIIVLGRRGGPEFLDSELARLGHLAALAASISERA
jgi:hypothetical protein